MTNDNFSSRIAELERENADLRSENIRLRVSNSASDQSLFEKMIDGYAIHEIICNSSGEAVDYRFLSVNPAFEKMTQLKGENIIGKRVLEVLPSIETSWIERYGRVALTGEPISFTNYSKELDKYFEVTAFQPAPKRFATIFVDVTERKRLETRLWQTQKMEAIGQLAGGIAHDFNNILGGIIGYTDMAIEQTPKESPVSEYLKQVAKGADRAKSLVKQILTYSQSTELKTQTIRLAPLIRESADFFKETIPSTVTINADIGADSVWALVEPAQIREMILHLATNAVQAMNNVGTLTFRLTDETIGKGVYGRIGKITPGTYLVLEVRDNGTGMDDTIVDRIFDPFFTTKDPGDGTGMGLSVVLGIVQGHGGNIQVETVFGQGTLFRIYLPTSTEPEISSVAASKGVMHGTERVLFVDDENMLVEMTQQMLPRFGYHVVGRTSSEEALSLFQKGAEQFDVLVTDQIMPRMTGIELSKKVLRLRPDLPIVLCSGFDSGLNPNRAKTIGIRKSLSKPYTPKELARAIREVIDT